MNSCIICKVTSWNRFAEIRNRFQVIEYRVGGVQCNVVRDSISASKIIVWWVCCRSGPQFWPQNRRPGVRPLWVYVTWNRQLWIIHNTKKLLLLLLLLLTDYLPMSEAARLYVWRRSVGILFHFYQQISRPTSADSFDGCHAKFVSK